MFSLLLTTALAGSPVVVELYTSEGCSSCPPADTLLAELASEDDVIALSFHVDYWDRLGWKDPTSSPDWTARQRRYASTLPSDSLYTPQAVVNGAAHAVGSRESQVRALIRRASGVRALGAEATWSAAGVRVRGDLPLGTLAFLVEDARTSEVPRGENAGRTLKHVSVVRAMTRVTDGAARLETPRDLVASAAHVVLVTHDATTGRVVAAGKVPITEAKPR